MKKTIISILLTLLIVSTLTLVLVSCYYCPIYLDNDGNASSSCLDNDKNASSSCGNAITDSSTVTCGGQTYRTIKIGSQTWMAENLNYNRNGSGCYGNDSRNCAIYGRLYNWNAALTVCPFGWHLPSNAEWTTLMNFVGSNAGPKLKTKSGWNGTEDAYGFSALPGGFCSGIYCLYLGKGGLWWSASEDGNKTAWRWNIYNRNSINMDSVADGKSGMRSVRCIQTPVPDTDHGT